VRDSFMFVHTMFVVRVFSVRGREAALK